MTEAPLVVQRAGQLLDGKYRLDRKLGEGAFGEVWLADNSTGHVVVKLLHPQWARTASVVERFRREAVASSRISHPHVCRVYDYATTDDDIPFIVMEYLTGGTLKEGLKANGPMRLGQVAKVMVPVCEAVAAAHQAGIVHRDLKPDNVMMTARDGVDVPVVLDFGIAKLLDAADKLTQSGTMMGSPGYMSPEQCEGALDIGPAADVYSLATLTFELLVGRTPFVSRSLAEMAMKHVIETPPPLVDVPPAFAKLVADCLAKKPQDRPTAGVLAAALRDAAREAPEARASFGPTTVNPLLADPAAATADQATVLSTKTPEEIAREMEAHRRRSTAQVPVIDERPARRGGRWIVALVVGGLLALGVLVGLLLR